MKKAWILKDASGKYYTGRYDIFWCKDPESAMQFFNEEEIEEEFKSNLGEESENLRKAEFPIEAITIYIK